MIIYLKKILIANFDFVIRLSYQNKIRRKRGYEKKKRYQLIAGATVLSMCVSLVNPVVYAEESKQDAKVNTLLANGFSCFLGLIRITR